MCYFTAMPIPSGEVIASVIGFRSLSDALTATENRVLRAMARVASDTSSRKSIVVLRYALLELQRWDDGIEFALCNDNSAHPLVADLYNALCRLVLETDLADGAGDLKLPAAPRYTEAWITQAGFEYLEHVRQ